VLAVALLPACTSSDEPAPAATGPVAVPSAGPPLPPADARACAALVEALPDEVDPGVRRRPVEGDDARSAAWGDPPVVLRCGVTESDRPEEPAQVNGVLWSVRDIGAGFLWTTQDRVPVVSVEVPDAYPNVAEIVNPLAEPVRQAVPLPSPAPSP
jgi:hypothetical protein